MSFILSYALQVHFRSFKSSTFLLHGNCQGQLPEGYAQNSPQKRAGYYKKIQGFNTIMQIDSVEIRKQVNPSPEYKGILYDTKIILQKGIDDKFKPTIREQFRVPIPPTNR